jgi:riboflavin-specific deaminase-like protein
MRRMLPDHQDLAVAGLYDGLTLPAGDERPWVALGMVSTLDGAAAVDGATADLGGEADGVAFRRLRDAADAILVGAGTVRDENYGPPSATAARRADRRGRGLAERPRLVIVTGSLNLSTDHRVFSDPNQRPLVVTHGQAPDDAAEALQQVADVVRVGHDTIDLAAALVEVGARGLRRILCEGGPSLNGSLLAEDLVDEIFLTISPVAAGGPASRIIRSQGSELPRRFAVASLYEHDGELIVRYCRDR